RDPVFRPGMDAHEVRWVRETVDPRDELRIGLLLLDLRTVVFDAFARPRIAVHRRDVEEAALELDGLGRPERANQTPELDPEIVVWKLVGLVMDQDGSEARRSFNDASRPRGRDRARETLGDEVEFEIHLIAELDEDVAIAAGKKSRFRIDHDSPRLVESPRRLNGGNPRAPTAPPVRPRRRPAYRNGRTPTRPRPARPFRISIGPCLRESPAASGPPPPPRRPPRARG